MKLSSTCFRIEDYMKLASTCSECLRIEDYMVIKFMMFPASILYKSIAGRYRPIRVADGPITARYRFIKNAYWVINCHNTCTCYQMP